MCEKHPPPHPARPLVTTLQTQPSVAALRLLRSAWGGWDILPKRIVVLGDADPTAAALYEPIEAFRARKRIFHTHESVIKYSFYAHGKLHFNSFRDAKRTKLSTHILCLNSSSIARWMRTLRTESQCLLSRPYRHCFERLLVTHYPRLAKLSEPR